MNIFVSGINYRTTPVEIREKLSFTIEEQKRVLEALKGLESVSESVFLSTCNRTEVYIFSESCRFDNELIERLLCESKGISIYDYKKHFYFYSSMKAVKHLFKVTSGLDSQVLGEDQILGQVKNAYELSIETGASAKVLNTLFRDAITAAKKVKTYTGLSKSSISTASLSIKLLQDYFNDELKDKCALVIGAGKIGSIALKNLLSKGLKKLYVTARSHKRVDELQKEFGNVDVIEYSDRYSVIDACDIVISATTSPHYTITRDMLEKVIQQDKKRAFIDLAVPRDIDVSIREMKNIAYFNMDDLRLTIDENIDKRLLEVSKAEEILEEGVVEFEKWYEFRGILPVIKDIQRYARDVANERTGNTLSRLKCASEEDKELVRVSIATTVNEIVNKLVYSVRECDSKDDVQAYFRCLSEVIKVDEG